MTADPADRIGAGAPIVALNPYQYGLHNPLRHLDPTGSAEFDLSNRLGNRTCFSFCLTTLEAFKPGVSLEEAVEHGRVFREVTAPTIAVAGYAGPVVSTGGAGAVRGGWFLATRFPQAWNFVKELLAGETGVIAPTTAGAGAATVATVESSRRTLVQLISQRARQLELGQPPKGRFNPLEGAGGARIEQVLGRTIQRKGDTSADFVDRVLGDLELKGPLPREFVNNPKAFSGLLEQVAADIRVKSGARNLFVDVTGMSPADIQRMQQTIQEALELSNTQKRVWIIQVP